MVEEPELAPRVLLRERGITNSVAGMSKARRRNWSVHQQHFSDAAPA